MEGYMTFKTAMYTIVTDIVFWGIVLVVFFINLFRNSKNSNGLEILYSKALWIDTLVLGILLLTALSYISYGYGYSYKDSTFTFFSHFKETQIKKEEITDIKVVDAKHVYTQLKINGMGLKNFSSGIFRLSNGEKAMVYINNPKEDAVIIKTCNHECYYINDGKSKELFNLIRETDNK